MTQISPSEREGFAQRYRMLQRAWFDADGDGELSDNIILDLFNEIDDLLKIPRGN